jgi:hypothetical protein
MDAVRVETRPEMQTTTVSTILGRPAVWTDYTSVFWAGAIAGILFLVIEMIFEPIWAGINGWLAMRQFGGILAGTLYLAPATFNIGQLFLALVFTALMGILYTAFGVALVRPTTIVNAVIGGAVLGMAFYIVNYYMWSGLFPWFANYRNWVTALNHVLVGAVAGLIYLSLRNRLQSSRKIG